MKSEIHQPVPELPVKDVEKAQAFYRDELGFSIAWIYPDKSIGAVSKGETAIFFRKQAGTMINTHWIFADDIDEVYEEIKLSRIKIIEPIENKSWGMRQFTIEDIDGNRFIFHHDI
jgi:predicted enzyme related to lactoylglutathione lyase